MCGIAGYINFKNNIDCNVLWKMTKIIQHRGPDDEGYLLCNRNNFIFAHGDDSISEVKESTPHIHNVDSLDYNIGLGHRRLSILDLSYHGHQPMADENNNFFIVYNGEIYNYVEIKQELIKKGYNFTTHSDTEVILKAYQEWGTECVNRFNGMWAFAIWDYPRKILWCSRDRFGVKPFNYYYDKEKFLFGSEIKQILEDKTVPRITNEKKIYDFLILRHKVYNNETFFQGINSLPGGSNLQICLDPQSKDCGLIQIEKYWELGEKNNFLSFSEAITRLKEELERSIKWRLRSDVPIGSCLSGGLDSSSIVGMTNRILLKNGKNMTDFDTFTACYDGSSIDERVFSHEMVESTKCREHLVFPTVTSFKRSIEQLIWHQEELFASSSMFAEWCIMEEVNKQGIKVLLGGQGGDEALLGYERYYVYYFLSLLKKGKVFKFLKEYNKASRNSGYSKKKLFLAMIYFSLPRIRYSILIASAKKFINRQFLFKYKRKQKFLERFDSLDNVQRLQRNDLMEMSLASNLHSEDRNTMAFSIESRAPFVDYQLVEYCFSLPFEYKINEGWTKALLREAMIGVLPEKVRLRKNKFGFQTPEKEWLVEMTDYLTTIFSGEIRSGKFIDKNMVLQLIRDNPNDKNIWNILCLETWMRVFDVKVV